MEMKTYYDKGKALAAIKSGEVPIRIEKTKPNRRHGAYLQGGSRAPDRGQTSIVASNMRTVEAFFG